MACKIQDQWELYSFEEFTLRKSLLRDHVGFYQNREALFQTVNIKLVLNLYSFLLRVASDQTGIFPFS